MGDRCALPPRESAEGQRDERHKATRRRGGPRHHGRSLRGVLQPRSPGRGTGPLGGPRLSEADLAVDRPDAVVVSVDGEPTFKTGERLHTIEAAPSLRKLPEVVGKHCPVFVHGGCGPTTRKCERGLERGDASISASFHAVETQGPSVLRRQGDFHPSIVSHPTWRSRSDCQWLASDPALFGDRGRAERQLVGCDDA